MSDSGYLLRGIIMSYPGSEETESEYLISSRRQRCQNLLNQEELSEEDLIELYIALHVVLEVGLNALLRHIALWHVGSNFNRLEVIKQTDDISFQDKMAMFLYHNKFDFTGREKEIANHHSILNKILHFAAIRNQLLHGHAISTFILEGKKHDSDVRQKMNNKTLRQQIQLFRDIIEGVIFYIDCLNVEKEGLDKEGLKKKYLNLDFLDQSKIKP